MSNVWQTLSRVDVSKHTEEKNGLTYLSWAWAWGKLKDIYPDAKFHKHCFGDMDGNTMVPYMSDEDGWAWVMVTVTVEENEATEILPVLNYKNQSVKKPDAFQVNTALQRCLAKCVAMHGLGHYIYAGEDLPPSDVKDDITITVEKHDGYTEEFEGLKTVSEVFKTWIPECKTEDELRGFWKVNKEALDLLKNESSELYNEVETKFKEKAANFRTMASLKEGD